MSQFKSNELDFDKCFLCWCDESPTCGLSVPFDTPQCKVDGLAYFCGTAYPYMYISEEVWQQSGGPKPANASRFPTLSNVTTARREFVECLHDYDCMKTSLKQYLQIFLNRTADCDQNQKYDCNDALHLVHAGPRDCVTKSRSAENFLKIEKIYNCTRDLVGAKRENEERFLESGSPLSLVAGILIPLVLVALATIIFYICWRRRTIKLKTDRTPSSEGEKRVLKTGSVNHVVNLPLSAIIPPDELFIIREKCLGEGQFGFVFQGTYKDLQVAVKAPKPQIVTSAVAELEKEFEMMITVGHHNNIVRFYGAEISQISRGIAYIVMELSPHGSLIGHLRFLAIQREEETEKNEMLKVQCFWAEQIASAMEHLENKKVLHGDLAARNVLVFDNNVVKVTDFGFARNLGNYEEYEKKEGLMPWRWMALESLERRLFSIKSDVWAYGVTVWEIFTLGVVPYTEVETCTALFLTTLRTGHRLPQPDPMSVELYSKLLECWRLFPEERPSFENLKAFFCQSRIQLQSITNNAGAQNGYEVVRWVQLGDVSNPMELTSLQKKKAVSHESAIENRYVFK